VDTPEAAARLVTAIGELAARIPVVLPLHPRGRVTLGAAGLHELPEVMVVDPLGYLDFLSLVRGAALVVTDSGGIQEETTVLRIPCLTLRPNTERPVTITHGTNRLVAPEELPAMVDLALAGGIVAPGVGPPLWDGHAGERIAAILVGRAD
jgi:UDP-N-acetylglucosamine 2-epimerase (non-hydrolysing)